MFSQKIRKIADDLNIGFSKGLLKTVLKDIEKIFDEKDIPFKEFAKSAWAYKYGGTRKMVEFHINKNKWLDKPFYWYGQGSSLSESKAKGWQHFYNDLVDGRVVLKEEEKSSSYEPIGELKYKKDHSQEETGGEVSEGKGRQSSLDKDIIGKRVRVGDLKEFTADEFGMDDKEYKELLRHDGERAKIIGVAIDHGSFDESYFNIKFDDGYKVDAISAYHLILEE